MKIATVILALVVFVFFLGHMVATDLRKYKRDYWSWDLCGSSEMYREEEGLTMALGMALSS